MYKQSNQPILNKLEMNAYNGKNRIAGILDHQQRYRFQPICNKVEAILNIKAPKTRKE
jgi:hypothetical protein